MNRRLSITLFLLCSFCYCASGQTLSVVQPKFEELSFQAPIFASAIKFGTNTFNELNFVSLTFDETQTTTQQKASEDFKKLSWLEGTWNRTNAKPGRTAHERWVKNGNQEMKGWGVSMNGADTAFVEKLKLVVRDNAVYYVAEVPGNKGETLFKLTQVTDKSAVFENPQHDFPKKIEYVLDGRKLRATISADGKSMDYLFERK